MCRCSQRCSQRALVLKTTTPQVVDLRRHVELEGIEPSTSSMPSMSNRSEHGSERTYEDALDNLLRSGRVYNRTCNASSNLGNPTNKTAGQDRSLGAGLEGI